MASDCEPCDCDEMATVVVGRVMAYTIVTDVAISTTQVHCTIDDNLSC